MIIRKTYFCDDCYTKFTIELDDVDEALEPEYCPFCGSASIDYYEDIEDEELGEE